MLRALRKFISRLLRVSDCHIKQQSVDGYAEVRAVAELSKNPDSGSITKPRPCAPPEIFLKCYSKVIPHDVVTKGAICITSDIAVLGSADLSGGDTCITGNVLVAGDVSIKGSPCITGTVIILGSARIEGQACVTGDCFVHGDLSVRGNLDVGGRLCTFGSKDIQPSAATELGHSTDAHGQWH